MARRPVPLLLALALAVAGVTTSCGTDDGASATGDTGDAATTVRVGYFPNVTHAPAIVGVKSGTFADALGDAELELRTFNAGGEAVEALFGGGIDITFIGPNPAINGYAQSGGEAVRLLAGTTSGGAALVVRPGIDSPDDLAGTTLSSPALGNTQDVALRSWLLEQGFEFDETGAGDLAVVPQANPDILTGFLDGQIDGAWVPEPWATRLVEEGGGQVLVDERDEWPDGEFVTTHVLVRTEFLEANPELVEQFLEGVVDAIQFTNENPAEAQTLTNEGIEEVTGNPVDPDILARSWENLTFTWDPIASSLEGSKEDAVATGLLEEVDLDGIYDLGLLNGILEQRGLEPVSDS